MKNVKEYTKQLEEHGFTQKMIDTLSIILIKKKYDNYYGHVLQTNGKIANR